MSVEYLWFGGLVQSWRKFSFSKVWVQSVFYSYIWIKTGFSKLLEELERRNQVHKMQDFWNFCRLFEEKKLFFFEKRRRFWWRKIEIFLFAILKIPKILIPKMYFSSLWVLWKLHKTGFITYTAIKNRLYKGDRWNGWEYGWVEGC